MTYYSFGSRESEVPPRPMPESWVSKGWTRTHEGLHEEQPYASCEVLWSESGSWKEQPAHLLLLKVQHVGTASSPIDIVYLTFNLAEVVKGPFGTPNDRATRIGLFGHVQARGLPKTESTGASDEIMGTKHFQDGANAEERFVYRTRVYQDDLPDGPRVCPPPTNVPMNGLDNYCYHAVDATIEVQIVVNPAYAEDAPDVTIGMVVLTKGKLVTLCAHSEGGGMPGMVYFLPCTNPINFCPRAPALIPEGQSALGPVFDPESVKAKIRELCSWTDPYQAVSSPRKCCL